MDPVQETVHRYNEFASEYADRWLNPAAMTEQRNFFAVNLPGPRVLDVGCGPGRDMKFFCAMGCRVLGVDLSSAFLNIAQDLVPQAHLVRGDMRRLAFADRAFHGVWACASLLHIPHREALPTIREFARLLDPGGLLYLSVKEGEGQGFNERGIFYAYYHLEEVGRLADVSGFEVIRLCEIEAHAVFIDLFARRML